MAFRESQVFTPAGPLSGLDSIRKFFADFFDAIPKGSAFEMKQLSVKDDLAYIVWSNVIYRKNRHGN